MSQSSSRRFCWIVLCNFCLLTSFYTIIHNNSHLLLNQHLSLSQFILVWCCPCSLTLNSLCRLTFFPLTVLQLPFVRSLYSSPAHHLISLPLLLCNSRLLLLRCFVVLRCFIVNNITWSSISNHFFLYTPSGFEGVLICYRPSWEFNLFQSSVYFCS